MAERLRAQEERARQQAAGAVEAAREERDREAEAAEEARGAEARTRMLLRVRWCLGLQRQPGRDPEGLEEERMQSPLLARSILMKGYRRS